MKQSILFNWNFGRVLRLAAGIIVIVQAFMISDLFLGIAGFLFSLMPLFNIGCSTGACYTPPSRKMPANEKEISFEELK